MVDYCSEHQSKLEIFPDELFYELFEYISIYDLSRAFFGLNKRIDHILKNLSNLSAIWTTATNDRVIEIFAPYITQLVVWRGGTLNLHRFKKLRSLKLALPSIEQCNEIQGSTILEHLHIDTLVSSSKITEQVSILFLTNAFPRLRSCRIDHLQFHTDNVQLLPTLYSLITRTPMPARLFSLCPNLIDLRLNLEKNITENIISHPHLNLHHLKIRIYSTDINLQTIENILSFTPNVFRFVLHGPSNPSTEDKFNISSIASLITIYLKKLRFLRITLPLNDTPINSTELENRREIIRKLHPLFNHISFRLRSHHLPSCLLISSRTNIESQFC